jgi:4-diphosphocytidyl-2-C-methyl-D-erythritol kinase
MYGFDTLLAMDTVCSRPAYAKVNLHLAVGFPYPDGYHPIQSLFALVDLSDDIEVSWKRSKTFSVEVTGLEAYCKKDDDTLTKAARLWHEAGGCPLQTSIRCRKQIPIQAGLGGGSSDAASLLLLLQEIAGDSALEQEVLEQVALKVGSDVPFFLSGAKAAVVTGRGEHVVAVEPKDLTVLLVMPTDFAISTSSAYRLLDESRQGGEAGKSLGMQEMLHVYKKSSAEWKGLLYNDFQSCAPNKAYYAELMDISSPYGGFASMSGSGACWFFVSEDRSQVQAVHTAITAAFGCKVKCWLTRLNP